METKFKVGDKVRVKSLEWYNNNKDEDGNVILNSGCGFSESMKQYCGKILKISKLYNDFYYYKTIGNSYVWQDWMLEDEVVTEEKQEDKQLNKNDMETKELTQEEIFEFLNCTKILCTSTEESINVQKKLFELGIEWSIRGKEVCINYFLLFIEDKKITFTPSMECWVKDGREKIEVSKILSIKIKEDKPKFVPKSLRPFDKVLVREIGGLWTAGFFNIYENGYCLTSGHCWSYCVPYNEETKHLHGSANEAPEFYQVWKK